MIRSLAPIAAALVAGPALAHEPIEFGGAQFHIMLEAEDTGGSIGMFAITQPGPSGPPRHIHDDADEAFYVLEGEFEVLSGEDVVVVPEGEAAFAPRGAVHTFRAMGEDGGKILVIVSPGGFEGFFKKLVEEGIKMPEDMERFEAISQEFQQRMAGPPLGAE